MTANELLKLKEAFYTNGGTSVAEIRLPLGRICKIGGNPVLQEPAFGTSLCNVDRFQIREKQTLYTSQTFDLLKKSMSRHVTTVTATLYQ